MKTKVQKWGNSLAVRIPKSFANETSLEPEAEIDLSLVQGKLVITPLAKPGRSLEQLLAGVTEQNLHTEVETGRSVGNEVW